MTQRAARRRTTTRFWVVMLGAVLLLPLVPPAPIRAADDLLPDLKATKTTTFRIRYTSSERRLLRFTSQMVNYGDGPMEIRASRPNTSTPWTIEQVIRDDEGGTRRVPSSASLVYAGDGHDHWHVRRVMTYHLWSIAGTYRDVKIGFCFFDTTAKNLSLPGAPKSKVYVESTCGKKNSLSTRTGLSVGWGDTYPWGFAYQWIDISKLPGGTYTMRTAVDLYDDFLETNEANNCSWTRLSFNDSGTTVKVHATGSACVNDWSTTTFVNDIQWLFDEAITSGCDADLFCTYNAVTRAEMAAFLTRAMHLPSTTADHFTDDDDSPHERAIDSIAEAGLTVGCAPGRFCPDDDVSRAEMASFLARALELGPSTIDRFTDDDGSPHERDINAIAAAGITMGCSATRYCPSDDVSRGAMAAFLHRAFDAP